MSWSLDYLREIRILGPPLTSSELPWLSARLEPAAIAPVKLAQDADPGSAHAVKGTKEMKTESIVEADAFELPAPQLQEPSGADIAETQPAGPTANAVKKTPGVRLIVFDFDQTISVVHVFKLLSGWCAGALGRASTELGQMRRVDELDVDRRIIDQGGFAWFVLGGEARIDRMHEFLQALKEQGVDLVVCTKGLVGTVRKVLESVDLLQYFTQVYGRIGEDYGVAEYDAQVKLRPPSAEEERLLGEEECGQWESKPDLIVRLRRLAELQPEQAVLVEDDPDEIARAVGACRTVWVEDAKGMTEVHFAKLLDLADERPES